MKFSIRLRQWRSGVSTMRAIIRWNGLPRLRLNTHALQTDISSIWAKMYQCRFTEVHCRRLNLWPVNCFLCLNKYSSKLIYIRFLAQFILCARINHSIGMVWDVCIPGGNARYLRYFEYAKKLETPMKEHHSSQGRSTRSVCLMISFFASLIQSMGVFCYSGFCVYVVKLPKTILSMKKSLKAITFLVCDVF